MPVRTSPTTTRLLAGWALDRPTTVTCALRQAK
jgi:hypothetical protein